MRILFLPNFRVQTTEDDDPSIPAPNRIAGPEEYWFLRHIPDVEVEIIDNRSPFPFGALGRLLKIELFQPLRALLRHREFDAIISHSFNAAFVFATIRSFLRLRTPPHFVIDVGSLNGGRERPAQIAAVKYALKSVKGLAYHSSVNEEFYARHFKNTARAYVQFGVDSDFFSPMLNDERGNYALSVGTGRRDYGTVLRAWRRIDFPLTILGGEGLSVDDNPSIKVMPQVPLVEFMDLVRNCRFVVLPLQNVRYSVGQMTLLQSMAMQKPVIVSDAFGVSDYCVDGENCLKYKPGDDNDLEKKVRLLLASPEIGDEIALKARKRVSAEFSEKVMALRLNEFITAEMNRSS